MMTFMWRHNMISDFDIMDELIAKKNLSHRC